MKKRKEKKTSDCDYQSLKVLAPPFITLKDYFLPETYILNMNFT